MRGGRKGPSTRTRSVRSVCQQAMDNVTPEEERVSLGTTKFCICRSVLNMVVAWLSDHGAVGSLPPADKSNKAVHGPCCIGLRRV